MSGRRLGILQVSTFDTFGGAARVAWGLFQAYRRRGHDAWLAVGERRSDDPDVFPIPAADGRWRAPLGVAKAVEHQLGIEDFHFPGTERLLRLPPRRPDVLHAHNLHGGYFDLRRLDRLSREVPTLLSLHDAWLLSGHCGHSLDCERWRIGCGHCPYLDIDPPVRRDATAFNWRRKAAIYRASRLHIATPSRWLMSRVEASMLAAGMVEGRVVPNGVDLNVFTPGDRAVARARLGIPVDAPLVLVAANAIRTNVWKDFALTRAAVERAAARLASRGSDAEGLDGLSPTVSIDRPALRLVALGDDGPIERLGAAEVRFVPFQHDPQIVATWYRAADVYVQAARADTFPNAVIEALASGTPVVATAVGGIPEQIEEGRTGYLVPAGDASALADRLVDLLTDTALHRRMAAEAATRARPTFGLERQVDAYLEWYAELVDRAVADRSPAARAARMSA